MSPSNVEFLASEPTALGIVYLRRRDLLSEPETCVLELLLDHALLMSSHSTASERALAQRGIELHGRSGLRVLVGGLGLGYTAREVLRSPRVAAVEVVELLAPLIAWFDRGLLPLGAELAADPRFALRSGDVYARLLGPSSGGYDVVLIDVDHSPEERLSEREDGFYGVSGLTAARAHLAEAGVLGVWSYAESAAFTETLARVFGEVHVEPLTFWNPVIGAEETNWLYLARR